MTNLIVPNSGRNNVRQKNGAFFRFYILRVNDLRNALTVSKDRYAPQEPLPSRGVHSKSLLEKKKAHEEALKRAQTGKYRHIKPNLPPEYMNGSVTHLDVNKFKVHWDQELSTKDAVVESRAQGVRYQDKHALRNALAKYAVAKGIAFRT